MSGKCHVLVSVGFTIATGLASTAGAAATAPTYVNDVAPLMFQKCVSCHRPGEVAPMSLMSYEEIRPWVRAIKTKVSKREMPPWFADPKASKQFANDLSLTQQQIDTLVSWVDAGAPRGDGPAPQPPKFMQGWHTLKGRAPDAIIEMPVPFDIPAEGEIPNFSIWSENPFKGTDKYMEAIELRPEVIAATHHSSVGVRKLPPGTKLGRGPAWKGGPLVDSVPLNANGSVWGVAGDANEANAPENGARVTEQREALRNEAFSTRNTPNLLLFYVPGGGFYDFPNGAVKAIHSDDVLTWGLHYTPTGKPEKDRHRLGLWFARTPPTHEIVTQRVGETHIVEGKEVGPRFVAGGSSVSNIPNIPAHAGDWKITGITAFQEDTTLYGLWPHMHLRGKDMMFVVTFPDGREDVVINVPKYDFNWQLQYQFKDPMRLPAGTTIKTIGHFDNSAANKYNPAPGSTVYWSEQSWDEMFNGWMELSIDKLVIKATQTQNY